MTECEPLVGLFLLALQVTVAAQLRSPREAAMDDLSAKAQRVSSSELPAAAATATPGPFYWPKDAWRAHQPDGGAADAAATAAAPILANYDDIDFSQPSVEFGDEALSPRVMTVEQRDESDEEAGEGVQLHNDAALQRRQQDPQQYNEQRQQLPQRSQWTHQHFGSHHVQQTGHTDGRYGEGVAGAEQRSTK